LFTLLKNIHSLLCQNTRRIFFVENGVETSKYKSHEWRQKRHATHMFKV
jgi:hypothetical protein